MQNFEKAKLESSAPLQVGIDGTLKYQQAVIVALGCNDKGEWGDNSQMLEASLEVFSSEGLNIVAHSQWWSSKAWPNQDDPPFLNGVAIVETDLSPRDAMDALLRIEDRFGRTRLHKNSPRTLDLDLIAYGRMVGDVDGVLLPHPRSAERLFVMGPLAQILPDWVHPVALKSAKLLASLATVGVDAHPMKGTSASE